MQQLSIAEQIAALSEEERQEALAALSAEELASLEYNWRIWGRPNQFAPTGTWAGWLIRAGRGFGKTRAGGEWIRERVYAGAQFIHLIGATAADARDIMVEGESGLLAIFPEKERPLYEPSKRRLTFHTGARATLFSADEPERLRGPQCDTLWADEIGAWRYPETWDLAQMGLRLGNDPRWCATTTPRPTQLIKDLVKDPTVVTTVGSTYENKANLAPQFLSKILTKYEGTRLGRQELDGELLLDTPGAAFSWEMIEKAQYRDALPDMKRIVVAIDPATTSKESSDDTGIIVAGLGKDDRGYVLADLTCKESPLGWAKKAVDAYDFWKADKLIGESNNGGDLIESNLKTVRRNLPYRKVHASRGKIVRAEPIVSLYEQGRVSHCGNFKELETEMTSYVPDAGMPSPGRMDAMVWALTELMVDAKEVWIGVFSSGPAYPHGIGNYGGYRESFFDGPNDGRWR